jgi:antitoxin component YwqK of YwqJK toxin-antitoxin module
VENLIIRKTKALEGKDKGKFLRSYLFEGNEVYSETLDENLEIVETNGTLPDGLVKEFFDNGLTYFECIFKDGKRHGTSRIYYETGKINVEKQYCDGMLNGRAYVYYPTGRLREEFYYVKDIENGLSLNQIYKKYKVSRTTVSKLRELESDLEQAIIKRLG